ncbi:MAG: cyclic nucleotide-binding domain-containing protein [Microthrixaceae bacterium]
MNDSTDANAHFRNLPIFAGCDEGQLAEIDRVADEVHVEAGRTVLRQGDLGQEFAMIISGEADIIKDNEKVARIGPGAYFGEIALLDSIPRTASVVAAKDLVLEVIDKRGFNTLLDDLPSLSRSMLKGMAQRMAELEAQNDELRKRAGE